MSDIIIEQRPATPKASTSPRAGCTWGSAASRSTPVEGGPLHTIKRHRDEPKLAVGDTVAMKDGAIGVIIARYIPSAHPDEVRYLVRVGAESGKDMA